VKIRTSELIGPALDWAVAKCAGEFDWNLGAKRFLYLHKYSELRYSTDWDQGGPIIEREKLRLDPRDSEWQANSWNEAHQDFDTSYGPTPLIAAMRCYVASKLGDEVDVPEKLT
jgi:hypothetical protein